MKLSHLTSVLVLVVVLPNLALATISCFDAFAGAPILSEAQRNCMAPGQVLALPDAKGDYIRVQEGVVTGVFRDKGEWAAVTKPEIISCGQQAQALRANPRAMAEFLRGCIEKVH